jgi:hypothetical protein
MSVSTYAVVAQEFYRVFQLPVVANCKPKTHSRWSRSAAFCAMTWKNSQRMMLVVAAQKGASFALPLDFFGQGEAEHLGVPAFEFCIVVDKKFHWTDSGDFKRLRQ